MEKSFTAAPDDLAVRPQLSHSVRVGTAGWNYRDWIGPVYPRKRPRGFHELGYLAQFFDVAEINTSFYGAVRPSTARKWLEAVAPFPHFQFTAKLHQAFTHHMNPAEPPPALDTEEFRAFASTLADAGKLGAVLAQFPWSFKNTADNRAYLERLLDTFTEYPMVVEARHASWDDPQFWKLLVDRGGILQYRSAGDRQESWTQRAPDVRRRIRASPRTQLQRVVRRARPRRALRLSLLARGIGRMERARRASFAERLGDLRDRQQSLSGTSGGQRPGVDLHAAGCPGARAVGAGGSISAPGRRDGDCAAVAFFDKIARLNDARIDWTIARAHRSSSLSHLGDDPGADRRPLDPDALGGFLLEFLGTRSGVASHRVFRQQSPQPNRRPHAWRSHWLGARRARFRADRRVRHRQDTGGLHCVVAGSADRHQSFGDSRGACVHFLLRPLGNLFRVGARAARSSDVVSAVGRDCARDRQRRGGSDSFRLARSLADQGVGYRKSLAKPNLTKKM